MDTYSKLLTGLKATTLPLPEVAARADVSLRWLYAVMNGDIKEPGVSRCERVLQVIADKRPEARP